ncbi:MAG: PspC domain-containing protein [Bacteroidota bacterium]
MDRERYRRRSSIAEEFDTSLMYDDIEKIRERDEEVEKDQNGKLGSAGMMAFFAGAALLATGLLGSLNIFPADLVSFLRDAAFPILGFGALGYGFYKTLKLAFRQKELNFPALNVYRKTKPVASQAKPKEEANSRAKTQNTSRTRQQRQRQEARSYRRTTAPPTNRKTLQRSRTNRVFSGVAGGIAEYAGISAALVRFAFIAGLFMAFPVMPIIPIIYFLLSIALPANYESYTEKRPPRRTTDPRM